MGSILSAECSCGFKEERLFVGGGMLHAAGTCLAPAVCRECGNFFTTNYIEIENSLSCPRCAKKAYFYNDQSLRGAEGSPLLIFQWRLTKDTSFDLPDAKYYCPNCQRFELRFKEGGCWD